MKGRDRNNPCRCQSGKKYKRCCWDKDKLIEKEKAKGIVLKEGI